MLWVVFRQSLRENLRFKRLIPWLLLGCLTFIIAKLLGNASNSPQIEQYGNVSYLVVFRILGLAAAIMTSTIIAAEVEQKTIVYLLTRPVPRWILLLGRYLACSIVVALATSFAALTTSLAVYGGDFLSNPLLTRDLWAFCIGSLAYCGLFTLTGLLFNRAMIVNVLFCFGWETSVPNMPGSVYYVSIYSHLQAIAQHTVDTGQRNLAALASSLNSNKLSASVAIPVLIGVILVTVGLGLLVFSTFEFIPREDVE